MENCSEWELYFSKGIEAVTLAKHTNVVMISSIGVEQPEHSNTFATLKKCELSFKQLRHQQQDTEPNQQYSIIRCTLGQEPLLVFSRLIQETGELRVRKRTRTLFPMIDIGYSYRSRKSRNALF
jgi:hypothetical protein